MGTPAHKKAARQELLKKQKIARDLKKSMSSVHGSSAKSAKTRRIRNEKLFTRKTKEYPSLETPGNPGCAPRREPREYTGSYLVGLATVKKSNAVPISREGNPEEFAAIRMS